MNNLYILKVEKIWNSNQSSAYSKANIKEKFLYENWNLRICLWVAKFKNCKYLKNRKILWISIEQIWSYNDFLFWMKNSIHFWIMDLRLCKKIMFRAFRINWRTFESEEKIRSNHPVINYFLIWSGPMGGFSFLPFFSISGRRKKSSKKKLGKQASQPAFPILQTFF